MLGEQPNISIFDVKTSGSWLHSGAPLRLPEGSMCAIDHLEHRFEDMSFRQRLLVLLNGLLYTRHCRVWITSARDPLEQLQESGAADLDAWRRLLQSFRLQVSGITRKPDAAQIPEIESLVLEKTGVKAPHLVQLLLDECSLTPWLLSIGKQTLERLPARSMPTREELLFEIGVAAEPFYRSVWSACSKDEKLTIRQLAKEGVVNPCNQTIVGRLVCTGLIWRDPFFRVINESFRRFVLQERQAEGLDAREHEGVQWPWSSVTATILTLALGLFAGLVLTSQQLVESWLGYVPALIPAFLPALAPAFPTLARLAAGIQRTGKPAQEATG
jgi:hypothetical protein